MTESQILYQGSLTSAQMAPQIREVEFRTLVHVTKVLLLNKGEVYNCQLHQRVESGTLGVSDNQILRSQTWPKIPKAEGINFFVHEENLQEAGAWTPLTPVPSGSGIFTYAVPFRTSETTRLLIRGTFHRLSFVVYGVVLNRSLALYEERVAALQFRCLRPPVADPHFLDIEEEEEEVVSFRSKKQVRFPIKSEPKVPCESVLLDTLLTRVLAATQIETELLSASRSLLTSPSPIRRNLKNSSLKLLQSITSGSLRKKEKDRVRRATMSCLSSGNLAPLDKSALQLLLLLLVTDEEFAEAFFFDSSSWFRDFMVNSTREKILRRAGKQTLNPSLKPGLITFSSTKYQSQNSESRFRRALMERLLQWPRIVRYFSEQLTLNDILLDTAVSSLSLSPSSSIVWEEIVEREAPGPKSKSKGDTFYWGFFSKRALDRRVVAQRCIDAAEKDSFEEIFRFLFLRTERSGELCPELENQIFVKGRLYSLLATAYGTPHQPILFKLLYLLLGFRVGERPVLDPEAYPEILSELLPVLGEKETCLSSQADLFNLLERWDSGEPLPEWSSILQLPSPSAETDAALQKALPDLLRAFVFLGNILSKLLLPSLRAALETIRHHQAGLSADSTAAHQTHARALNKLLGASSENLEEADLEKDFLAIILFLHQVSLFAVGRFILSRLLLAIPEVTDALLSLWEASALLAESAKERTFLALPRKLASVFHNILLSLEDLGDEQATVVPMCEKWGKKIFAISTLLRKNITHHPRLDVEAVELEQTLAATKTGLQGGRRLLDVTFDRQVDELHAQLSFTARPHGESLLKFIRAFGPNSLEEGSANEWDFRREQSSTFFKRARLAISGVSDRTCLQEVLEVDYKVGNDRCESLPPFSLTEDVPILAWWMLAKQSREKEPFEEHSILHLYKQSLDKLMELKFAFFKL